MVGQNIKTGIIVVVTIVWVVNFILGATLENHRPDPTVNVAFMAIVGSLFALPTKKPGSGGEPTHRGGSESDEA